MDAINQTVNNIINIATGVGLGVCILMLMVGGYHLMMSGGSPRGQETGKSAIMNAAIGFGVILAARVLAGIIQTAVAH